MFEESMVESFAAPVPETRRWTMAASLIFQISAALILFALPMLYPEGLMPRVKAPLVFMPTPHHVPVAVPQSRTTEGSSARSTTTPNVEQPANRVFLGHGRLSDDAAPISDHGIHMGEAMPSLLADQPSQSPRISAASVQTSPKSVRISQLSAGMLLAPIRPIYPAIAKAAGVSGEVVVRAVISSTGMIESLQVLSGPQLLRHAALDAIEAARYKPFILNGQPVEVQTTITVSFRLSA